MYKTVNWVAQVLPDETWSHNQALANGGARDAVFRGWGHLLRTTANMPPRSVSSSLIAAYTPHYEKGDRQSRLQLYVQVVAQDDHIAQAMDTLVRGSLLHRLYQLQAIAAVPPLPRHLTARCHILRREDFITPLHSRELNAHIPDFYYSISSFTANEKNSNLEYDRVLDSVGEEVRIVVRVEPEDVLDELAASTAYLARLEFINRDSGFHDDDFSMGGPAGGLEGMFSNWHDRIRPLHRRDPLADELTRTHRRFHETLHQPHVLFNITVAAETEATARLIGSIVAESAFEGGSYRLVVGGKGDETSAGSPASGETGVVELPPIAQSHWPDVARDTYAGFERLSQLACVDELLGVFRFPVASFASPCCIRKDTDPPEEDPRNMIVLGYDQQLYDTSGRSRGSVRGLPLDLLNRHWFVAGKTRSGKSTAIMNVVLQLSGLLSPDELEEV
jgi:hypothetical protein